MSIKTSNGYQKFTTQTDQIGKSETFSFESGTNELYSHSFQLSYLLKSLNLNSVDPNSTSIKPLSKLIEIKSYINSIVQDLNHLGIPPSNESKSYRNVSDALNLLSFASIVLINQMELQNNNSLEHEIESIKIQNKQIEEEFQSRGSQINSLHVLNDQLTKENKEKDKRIHQLEKQLKSMKSISSKSENHDLELELELKSKENSKLQQALNSLSKELTSLSINFQTESKQKNEMFTIIDKQRKALDEYDSIYQEYQTKLQKMELTLQTSQSRISKLESNKNCLIKSNDYSELFGSLQNLLTTKKKNDFIVNCIRILNSPNDSFKKVIEIVDYLLNNSNQPLDNEINEIKTMNGRLIQYIQSMVEFFEHLANSAEMQSWMLDYPCTEDLRPLLLSQCNKVEHFIKTCQSSKNSLISIANNDNLEFLSLSGQVEVFLDKSEISKSEAVSILHLSATANDALRRCAEHVIDLNRQLEQQMNNMREEMRRISTDCQNDIYEATEKIEIELEKVNEQRKIDQKLIADIKNELLTTENIDKCISMIDGDTNYKNKLQKTKIKQKNDEIEKQQKLITSLRNQLKISKDQIAQLALTQKEYESLKQEIKIIEEETTKNKQKMELKLNSMKNENVKLLNEKDSLTQNLNELQSKLNESIKEKERIENQLKEMTEMNDKTVQDLIHKQKNEVESEQLKNNEIKIKYEKNIQEIQTQMENQHQKEIDQIKVQLETEKNNKEEIIKEKLDLINENKQISSELTAVKIDNKILRMKIGTIEEKVMRDKNLAETQCKLKLLNMQSKHESEIETIKADNECQNHRFRISIIQYFKEYVNFGDEITSKAVFEVLDKVASDLEKLNKKCESQLAIMNDFDTVKKLLFNDHQSKSIDQICIEITDLLSIKSQFKKLKKEFKNLQEKQTDKAPSNEIDSMTSYEWEQWAKKVATIYSGNCSLNDSHELQFAIEEALMGGINQRLLIKRLEMLRSEKKILTSSMNQIKPTQDLPINLSTLMIVLSSIWKLRKISGHFLYKIPQKKPINEETKTKD